MKIKAALLAIAASFITAPAIAQTTPPGYFRIQQGIYGQWCWSECVPANRLYRGAAYVGLRVWCRDSNCGEILGKVSFKDGDTITDQDSDWLTLGKGQKGVFVFQSLNPSVNGYAFTEFKVYPLN